MAPPRPGAPVWDRIEPADGSRVRCRRHNVELKLDPARTALVVIDLQRGIVAMPTAPRSSAEVVARAAQLAKALRAAGGTVVLVRVTPSPDGKDSLRPITDAPAQAGGRPLLPDWAEIVPELARE